MQQVRTLRNLDHVVSGTGLQVAAQTDKELIAAPGAGWQLVITDLFCSLPAAGKVKWVQNTASSTTRREFGNFGNNGGEWAPLQTPLVIPENQNFGYTDNIGNVTVFAAGYKIRISEITL